MSHMLVCDVASVFSSENKRDFEDEEAGAVSASRPVF